MRFKHVFSIIGPVMIGPSSSHTAGAVRIGRAARQLLGCKPERAEIRLYGSFASTYSGHGTDLALVSGLLDFDTDDPRIPNAMEEAAAAGLAYELHASDKSSPHPNYVDIALHGADRSITLSGASIGGGNIEIRAMNGFEACCSGYYPTLVLTHGDQIGMAAAITGIVSRFDINIGYMQVGRKSRSGAAITVLECDRKPVPELVQALSLLPQVSGVSVIDLT